MKRFSIILFLQLILTISISAQESGKKQLFDDNWKFFRGNITGPEDFLFNDKDWRKVNLPHDWSIEDLPVLNPKKEEAAELCLDGYNWFFESGDNQIWKQSDFDDSNWQKVQLPDNWENHSKLTKDKAYGWYRKKIEIPEELKGHDLVLSLGKIDDADETYFNGKLIGKSGSFPPKFETAWNETRKYKIPKDLIKESGNIVSIRVYDETGDGGIYILNKPRVVSGPFDSEAIGGRYTGFTIGGTAWYRKHFKLPVALKENNISIYFEGVYMDCDVWINGNYLGNHINGYTGFHYNLTEHLNFGEKPNIIVVRVRNEGQNSRWYSGSGIYRHVWLDITDKIHISPWGVSITTPQVSDSRAQVNVQANIDNTTTENQDIEFVVDILNSKSEIIESKKLNTRIGYKNPLIINLNFTITNPDFWSPDSPNLYRAVCKIQKSGKVINVIESSFGIRTFQYDTENGFLLNNKSIKLKGATLHANNGPLGAAAFDRAEERRVEIMKQAGYNAIRCVHNPPSTAFLDACDRIGLLVICETFDVWKIGWLPDDYHKHFYSNWRQDVKDMIMRDRNHPSIFAWGIGNQVRNNTENEVVSLSKEIASYVRNLDPTRAVIANIAMEGTEWHNGSEAEWGKRDPIFESLDICGYSYQSSQYKNDHKRLPERIMLSTENNPKECFTNWMRAIDNKFVLGNFDWTAMDFMGEVGLGWNGFDKNTATFPWTTSYTGDLDICGFHRPRSYYRDVLFQNNKQLHLLVYSPVPSFNGNNTSQWGWDDVKTSWTWPGYKKKLFTIEAYSGYDSVQLILNDKVYPTLQTSRKNEFKAKWELPYEKGTLTAIGFNISGERDTVSLVTAGKPRQITLSPDRTAIKADGQDLCFITVELKDNDNNLVPYANNHIDFSVKGSAEIIAVGNSNPKSIESFKQPYRKAYEGKCLLVIRSKTNVGEITIVAKSKGLKTAKIKVKTQKDI